MGLLQGMTSTMEHKAGLFLTVTVLTGLPNLVVTMVVLEVHFEPMLVRPTQLHQQQISLVGQISHSMHGFTKVVQGVGKLLIQEKISN